MKRILLTIILVAIIFVLAKHIFFQVTEGYLAAFLPLSQQPVAEEQLLKTIRAHYRGMIGDETWDVSKAGTIITKTYTDINNDDRDDILVKIESKATCGTGGCISSIFIQTSADEFEPLDFKHSVKSIEPLPSFTRNMRDLRVNGDDSMRLIWDGRKYVPEII